jgi:hypothetical protein
VKYLLLASLLTACNFGLVDIEDKPKTCYELTLVVGHNSMHVDSTAYNCGKTKVTTPFDHLLAPVIP